MNNTQFLVFTIDSSRYGLPLSAVERVIRMIEITSPPGVSESILGVINVQGTIIPAIDLRRRLGAPLRNIRISDQLIIVRTAKGTYALPVDAAAGVIDCAVEAVVPAEAIVSGTAYLKGMVKQQDGMIPVYEPEQLLSLGPGALCSSLKEAASDKEQEQKGEGTDV